MSWLEGPSANWPDGEMWCSSYSECMCGYFDDLALSDDAGGYDDRINEGILSRDEANLASKFHAMARSYQEPDDNHASIINDPNWTNVVGEAAQLWRNLKYDTM